VAENVVAFRRYGCLHGTWVHKYAWGGTWTSMVPVEGRNLRLCM